MEFSIKNGNPEKQRSACLIVAVFESKQLSSAAQHLDEVSKGYLSKIISKGDIQGKSGQTLLLHNVPNILSERILLIGCGKESELSDKGFIDAIRTSVNTLNAFGLAEAICLLTECSVKNRDAGWKIQQAAIAAQAALYRFNHYRSKANVITNSLKRMAFTVVARKEVNVAEKSLAIGLAIAKGANFTKDLANTPANICTPAYLAKQAQKLSKEHKSISCAVLEVKDMQALGMGAILAVGQGSNNPPKLITLKYTGAKANAAPTVLVGKGITFDTGGNSLKTPLSMIGMKYDMSGAATVLGVLLFAAEMQLPLNLVGVIASAENMPGGAAIRPDDIIQSMAGISIEVANTDAEGRLVLCDALAYSERFKPAAVIDIATLTGACIVALGRHYSGLFSNNQALAQALETAGNLSGDKCWPMPCTEEYQSQLDSKFADVVNVGGIEAGSVTAACFLARFTTKLNWAHLDIAGSAVATDGKGNSATGRPVSLLAQYLLNQVNSEKK